MGKVIHRESKYALLRAVLTVLLTISGTGAAFGDTWWNDQWTTRKKVTIDTSKAGADIKESPAGAAVLVRLHDGSFNFAGAAAGGEDIRFIAADHKTVLPHYIEKFDPVLLNQAYVWVQVPDIKPGGTTEIWLYYGNTGSTAVAVSDPKAVLDDATVLTWHFAESGTAADSSSNGINGQTPPGIGVDGSLIGSGIQLDGTGGIVIPQAPALAWSAGGSMTFSAWVKPASVQPGAVLFTRGSGAEAFTAGLDNGIPFISAGGQRAAAGAALTLTAWSHLAVTTGGGQAVLYVDGEQAATLAAGLPALDTPATIGKPADSAAPGFAGEIDEVRMAGVARSPSYIKFSAACENPEKGAAVVSLGQDEGGGGGWLSGNSTSAVLVRSLTLDGWIVIGILAVMSVVSIWIMWSKMRYLGGITKGNEIFMDQWKHAARDLTSLDSTDSEVLKTMGGRVDKEGLQQMKRSSVYRLYHVGAEEVRHRMEADSVASKPRGLSARSMEAIKASMDGTMVRETQRLNKLIVLLTICISGGPFLGLLGTVIGVMITFAAIAAAGDVNVNSIAPGIAGALLATVAGLAVAIPALFGYNYIVSRIKEATADMHVFIDEFVTRMAEFYPEKEA